MTVEELRRWRPEGSRTCCSTCASPPNTQSTASTARCSCRSDSSRPSSATIPKDQPVVVHCKSGGRSAIAVAILKVAGYDAHNLSGGIQAWESESDRVVVT